MIGRAIAGLALALSAASCAKDACEVPSASAETGPIKETTPRELAESMASSPAVVIDVNPRDIYDGGHVPHALWMPSSNLRIDVLPRDRTTALVFYCYNESCGASHQAATAAVRAGWTNVARMPAGIQGWKAAGLPVEAGP